MASAVANQLNREPFLNGLEGGLPIQLLVERLQLCAKCREVSCTKAGGNRGAEPTRANRDASIDPVPVPEVRRIRMRPTRDFNAEVLTVLGAKDEVGLLVQDACCPLNAN